MRQSAPRDNSKNSAKLRKAENKVQASLKVLDDVLDSYERENPHWRTLALLWLIEGSLINLRRHLETGSRTKQRWKDPFVEVHYRVNWNWDPQSPEDPVITYGQISSAASAPALAKQISSIAVETVMQATLRSLTNDVALEKQGAKYLPLIPVEIIARLKKVRSPLKRQALLDELYRPFSMGAAEVDFDDEVIDRAVLSAKAKKKFLEQSQRMDLSLITATITKDKRTVEVVPVFQIHPLIVDAEAKLAYYPLTVGFLVKPIVFHSEDPLAVLAKPWAQPGCWSASDRRALWKHILGAFRQIAQSLKQPEVAPLKEAVLTVSAKLRVTIDPSSPEKSNEAVARMLKSFERTGEVVEMHHTWSHPPLLFEYPFPALLREVETSSLKQKGAALEKLVTALFESITGFQVKPNSRTSTEEIDLVIINGHDDPRWKTGSPLILVECKNRSKSAGKNDIVQFKAKLENRRGQCRLGFLISMNGFAETVKSELLRSSQGEAVIVLIDGKMIREAVEKNRFLSVLQSAWDQVVIS